MLDLWGMGGGLVEYRSALFASRGYASLSVAYIGHKELPGPQNKINVGDSYFQVGWDAGFTLSLDMLNPFWIMHKSQFKIIHFLKIIMICHVLKMSHLFCLDSQPSTYFKIIIRSAPTELGSSVCRLESTWLFDLPLTLVSKYVRKSVVSHLSLNPLFDQYTAPYTWKKKK